MSRRPAADKGWLAYYRELAGAWVRRNSHPDDAADAMQDTALRLLENGVGMVDDPRAYFARSTRNGVVDRLRHRAVLGALPLHDLGEDEHPAVEGPEAEVYSGQLLRELKAALGELPPACRQVYVHRRLEGWTHAEIARALGISRAMVEKHMTRALRHLSERLQHHE
ncbi:sigma-70 family RNA polymerase sigma factor [Castellaniella defragrans]|uniref:sigma-70 family RNA polymerase sigma factor n=1 Tax=Castellaniella defragrans TaxID=75697 RepID=UPI0023F25690|nr:sigma-70 family RNA polymerase sigma factor [Castellaniella defragrans]